MPVPSFTVMIWLMGTLVSLSTMPLGQVISRLSMLLRLSEAEVNARIVGGHVTHAALPLLILRESFGNQLQRRAHAVAIRLGSYQHHFQPVVGIAAIVAQQLGVIAADRNRRCPDRRRYRSRRRPSRAPRPAS